MLVENAAVGCSFCYYSDQTTFSNHGLNVVGFWSQQGKFI